MKCFIQASVKHRWDRLTYLPVPLREILNRIETIRNVLVWIQLVRVFEQEQSLKHAPCLLLCKI
jgi:hypothetical protein